MVKIIYEDWSNLPQKPISEVVTNHVTIKAAESDFVKRNWGKSYRIVSLEVLNRV